MHSRRLLAGAVLLAVITIYTIYSLTSSEDEGLLRASGTIEATEVDVSFQIGGHVAEVLVEEGQPVKSGDVMARLSSDELTARLQQIQASLDAVVSQARQQQSTLGMRQELVENQITQARSQSEAAQSAVDRLREGSRPQEIRVAEAELTQAQAEFERRRNDFERMSKLSDEGIIPLQQLDTARSALVAAETTLAAAKERLALVREGSRRQDIDEAEARFRAAQAGLGIAQSGEREIDIQRQVLDAAHARERELQAQLAAAQTQLGYTEIRSPLDGVVLTRNVETGEVVNLGTPVVTVADIDRLWMNVYVPESQTGLVKIGQAVRIRVDSFPEEEFSGKVMFISSESEFTPKTIQTQEERIKLVYRVKVGLENTQQRLKPGMPADAEIELR